MKALQRPSATQVPQHIHSQGLNRTQVQQNPPISVLWRMSACNRGVPLFAHLHSSLWLCQSIHSTPRWWRTGGWARSQKHRWGQWRGFGRCASVRWENCSNADACRSKQKMKEEIENNSTVTVDRKTNDHKHSSWWTVAVDWEPVSSQQPNLMRQPIFYQASNRRFFHIDTQSTSVFPLRPGNRQIHAG